MREIIEKDLAISTDSEEMMHRETELAVMSENLGEDLLGHMGKISEALGELGLKAVAK